MACEWAQARDAFERAAAAGGGPVVLAERTSDEPAVVDALRTAFEPFRTAAGGYRIETEWRYVIAET
jgi:hypothetical protein